MTSTRPLRLGAFHLFAAAFAAASLPAAPAIAQRQVLASKSEHNAILQREEGLWAAWSKRLQAVDAAPFYSQDPTTLHFDISPLKFNGWAEYERVAMAGIGQRGGTAKVTIADDFKVLKGGDNMLTALFTWHVVFYDKDGKPRGAGSVGRETDIWVKESDGQWRIAHQHMSRVPGERDPAPAVPAAARPM